MQQIAAEVERLQRENEAIRREAYNNGTHVPPEYQRDRPGTANTIQPQPSPYVNGAPQPMQVDPSRSLPPLANGAPAGSGMQGIQYTEDQRRYEEQRRFEEERQ